MFACGGQLTPSSSWLYGAGRREAAGEGMCCRHVALIPELLPRIWRDEQRYQKGGVMLADFTPASMQQGDLFAAQQQSQRSEALMQVIDKINQGRLGKWGRFTSQPVVGIL